MRRCLPAACLAVVLAACTAGPAYQRPQLPQAERYVDPATSMRLAEAGVASGDVAARWWKVFASPQLDALVDESLHNHPSLAAAQSALRAAREGVAAQSAAYFPSAQLDYAFARQKIPNTLASPVANNATLYNLHTAQITVSYTPDVFGANRRQVESLQAQADVARWELESAYLTLSTSVVLSAIQEAALREQIEATHRLVELQRDVAIRYARLRALGQVSALDVAQQEGALANSEAGLAPLDKALALQRDQLKVLLGRLPGEALAPEFHFSDLQPPASLPLTLPSTLADRRPDVLAAEAQLRAASALVGVAAANRLPTILLGVNAWGSSAYRLADLFLAGSGFWTLAGSVSQTVFDAGQLQHREAQAQAQYEQAAALYKLAVLTAFQSVADVLNAIDADARGLGAAERAQHAAESTLAITRRQLELGDVNSIATVLAEENLLQVSLIVAQARANRLSDAVALVQALGGGWWNRDEDLAGPPAK